MSKSGGRRIINSTDITIDGAVEEPHLLPSSGEPTPSTMAAVDARYGHARDPVLIEEIARLDAAVGPSGNV